MSENRKKLLNEGAIRRFMKLAEIDSLSETFISDKFTVNEEESFDLAAEDDAAEFDAAMTDVDDAEAALDDDEALEAPEEEASEGDQAVAMELAHGFAELVNRVLNVDVDVAGDGAEELEAAEDEDPAPLDMAAAPEDELVAGEDEDELAPGNKMYEELEQEGVELEEEDLQEKLTAEIARRVAARLVKESRQDKMADQLAERITQRLKNG